MLRKEDFSKEEIEGLITTLKDFQANPNHLQEQVEKYFQTYDTDTNGVLDKKELRKFLQDFFSEYKIHFPVTDDYVDAVFREIDLNKNNKIETNELNAYAAHFVAVILPEYEKIQE